jgi:four helix bundle protein
MEISNHKDLHVWQKAMDLAEEVYHLSKKFPKDEFYSLTNQIRRAVVSIPSNIAEGKCRGTKNEYFHFLSIALGSLAEVETQILLAIRLNYLTTDQAKNSLQLREDISKMLVSLRSKLQSS